jgi:tetratricopeptide (TPR) repeat protein
MDAYDLFLQALPGLYTFDIDKNSQSLDLLHRAIKIDPNYPQALAYAAWAYEQRLTRGWPGYGQNDLETAVSLARRSITTATEDPHALAFSGFVLVMTAEDYELGVLTGERALQNNPNIGFISMMVAAVFLFGGGDIIKAKECIEHAIRVSPKDPAAHLFYMIRGLIYLDLGEIEKAIESCKTSVQLFSTWDTSLWSLIAVLVENGEVQEAGKVVQRLLKVDTTTTVRKVNTNFRINNQGLKMKMIEGLRKAGLPEK